MADEPTGSLDFATGQEIIAQMFALNRALGSTLVLVTHDMQLARLCQQHVALQAERLTMGPSRTGSQIPPVVDASAMQQS
ncbi:MAG: hypothetical protein KBH08_02975 [Brachymonas sp.]|nr:hypothetical protein [Brachymonas sp.]MBP8821045.1 hypothetical protein [Brachymonas sp.]MBP9651410.1 hypothetical protein [Brachymonas sp.]